MVFAYFSYLQGVGQAGENATEFFNLYFDLTKEPFWKGYLASSGALLVIRDLITKVCMLTMTIFIVFMPWKMVHSVFAFMTGN